MIVFTLVGQGKPAQGSWTYWNLFLLAKSNLMLLYRRSGWRKKVAEKTLASLDEAIGLRLAQREKKTTYALQKVEGQISIDRRKAVLDVGLSVGDGVEIIKLPDGMCILSKTGEPTALRIRKITAAYVQFDGEVSIKEI